MKRLKRNNVKSTLASGSTKPLGADRANTDEEDTVSPLPGEEGFDTAYRDVGPRNSAVPVEPWPGTASTSNQPSISKEAAKPDQQNVERVHVPAITPNGDWPIHPDAAVFPILPEGALVKLAENIQINGLAHAIVRHEGQIVDGRNRFLACRMAGVDPQFVEWRDIYTGNLTLREWIWIQNAHRRHMTRVQLAASYLTFFGPRDREAASRAQVEGRRLGGQTAGHGRRKLNSSLSKPTASKLPDAGDENTAPAEPVPNRLKRAHSTGRRQKLAADFNISSHVSKQLLQVEAACPELLLDIVHGRLTLAKAVKLACPNETREAEGSIGLDLEPAIRKAVHAVEKLLACVPEDKQDDFKAAVAETVRNLP